MPPEFGARSPLDLRAFGLGPTLDFAHRLAGLGKDVWVCFVLVTGLKGNALGQDFTLRDTPSSSPGQIAAAMEIFAGEGLKAV